MKNILTFILFTLLLASCGGNEKKKAIDKVIKTGDIETLRKTKAEVLKSYDSIGAILSSIDVAIEKKDTLKKLPLVTTHIIKDTTFNHFVDVQGNVETDKNILIYPEYQGLLTQVYVKEGQRVNKGQLLAKIDDGGLSSQVAQMETQYQLAKTTFERQERLWKQKIGSEIQYLQAKANMESMQNSVTQMRSQLGRATVRAPFTGVIDEIITEQGQVVAPGAVALMRIVNLNSMYVKASIPESYLSSISTGKNVTITFPAIRKKVEGKIKSVGNYINPSNRTFDIQVNVDNKDNSIKPNLVAKLEINDYSKTNAKLIPSNIIQENSKGEKFVFILSEKNQDEAIVTKKQIETGLKYKGQVEILSGLENGVEIVSEGALTLKDGSKIKIKEIK